MKNDTTPNIQKTIRPAGPDDLELLLLHRMSMFRDMGSTDEALLECVTHNNRAYLSRALPAGEYIAWIVEAGAQPVGSGGYILLAYPPSMRNPAGLVGYILSIYTHPDWRRQGVARLVMDAILEDQRRRGIQLAALHASDMGRPLYEKLGFQQTNEMRLTLPSLLSC